MRGVPISRPCDKITKTNMEGAGAAPEGGEGRTTRPERTSRAGPLPVTFSPFVEFIFPLSGPLASHPRLHGTRREQTTSKFRCLMNGTRLFSPFSPLRFSFFLFFFSSIRLRCFRTFYFLFPLFFFFSFSFPDSKRLFDGIFTTIRGS